MKLFVLYILVLLSFVNLPLLTKFLSTADAISFVIILCFVFIVREFCRLNRLANRLMIPVVGVKHVTEPVNLFSILQILFCYFQKLSCMISPPIIVARSPRWGALQILFGDHQTSQCMESFAPVLVHFRTPVSLGHSDRRRKQLWFYQDNGYRRSCRINIWQEVV